MNVLTEKNFNAYLKTTVTNDASLAERIQAMIVFGINHYGVAPAKGKSASGDSRYLAALMNAKFRASRVEAIRAYIVAHTNLKCVKVDPSNVASDLKFVKDDKSKNKMAMPLPVAKDTGEVIEWAEFSKEKINIDFDIDARIKALIGQCTSAIAGKDGKKLKGTKKHAEAQLAHLKDMLTA